MVKTFNRTLETLLRVFMNEEHTNWDERLPYVMMVYRSSVNKTTGYTPNMKMIGEDITVPLDKHFANPLDEKKIWSGLVTKLQERMEQAHEFSRVHTDSEMCRQKRYHDNKLSWEKFEVGDEMFVLFLRRNRP